MSTSHLSPQLLRLVLSGDLPPKALIRMVLEHLLELCPDCRATWTQFKATHPGAILSTGPADDEDDDFKDHADATTTTDATATAASPYAAAFEEAAALLLSHAEHAALQQQSGDEEDEEAATAAELAELLALPRGRRAQAVEAAPRRFRSRALVEELLAESFRQVRMDGEESLDLAHLAATVLERVPEAQPRDDQQPPWAHALAVRSRAYAANARRVLGDLRAAESTLRSARAHLALFPLNDSRLHADLASLEASLRQDQRRLEEAETLLDRAAFLYREAGEPEGVAKVRVQQGAMLRVRGETVRAASTLREAVELAASLGLDRLQRSAVANLALTLCDADEPAAARRLVEDHRPLFGDAADRWTALRFVWLEGRIAAGLGETERAEADLEQARLGYLERGEGLNAALVSLDLAAVHAAAGRHAEVSRLAAALGPVFAARDVGREATAALVLFQQAAAAENVGAEMIRALRRQLERVRLQPAARLNVLPS